jgi:NAD(P)-dependent dehydrogenase (short-subunit alcohol dehydrogenase family)
MANKSAVLVTGASSGIGRATALLLDRRGFQVFAGVRKQKDAEALQKEASHHLKPVFIDVTDNKMIISSMEIISRTVGEAGLAGLVNNAGIAVPGPIEFIPIDSLRRQFEIDVIGQIAVTQSFLPLIRKAHGRIINIGSVGGRTTMPFGGALCAAKHAMEALNDALRMELHPWGIHVCLIAPASINTTAVDKLAGDCENIIGNLPAKGIERYAESFRHMVKTAVKEQKAGSPPEEVAEIVVHVLTANTPKTRYIVGSHSRALTFFPVILPVRFFDFIKLRLFGLPKHFGEWKDAEIQIG